MLLLHSIKHLLRSNSHAIGEIHPGYNKNFVSYSLNHCLKRELSIGWIDVFFFQAYLIACVWSCYKILLSFHVKKARNSFMFQINQSDETEVSVVYLVRIFFFRKFDLVCLCRAEYLLTSTWLMSNWKVAFFSYI